MNGFGNPNTEPCHDSRFMPHSTSTPTSHDGDVAGIAEHQDLLEREFERGEEPERPGDDQEDGERDGPGTAGGVGHARILACRFRRLL